MSDEFNAYNYRNETEALWAAEALIEELSNKMDMLVDLLLESLANQGMETTRAELLKQLEKLIDES